MAFNQYGAPSWWKQSRPVTYPPRYNQGVIPQWWVDAMKGRPAGNYVGTAGNIFPMSTRQTIPGGPPEIYNRPPSTAPGFNFGGGLASGYNWPTQGAPQGVAPAGVQAAATTSPYPGYDFGGGLFSGYQWPTTAGVPNATTPAGQAPATAPAPYTPPAPAQPQYQTAPPGINQQWYSQFQAEHQGQTPDEYYAMTSAQAGNPHEGLADALADLEWSQAFARDHGRPPNEDEWRWWWFTTREGGTPEAKAAAKAQGGGGGGGGGGGNTNTANPPTYVPPQVWWR